MRVRVRLFLLLLSIVLPVNGMAQMLMSVGQLMPQAHVEHVPTQSYADHGMNDGGSDCVGQHEAGHGSFVCKSGHECKSSSLLQISLGKPPALPLGQPLLLHPSDNAPALIPDAVWHPPRA